MGTYLIWPVMFITIIPMYIVPAIEVGIQLWMIDELAQGFMQKSAISYNEWIMIEGGGIEKFETYEDIQEYY